VFLVSGVKKLTPIGAGPATPFTGQGF
jgi:hypothetical protein